jgi:hypothetical protein
MEFEQDRKNLGAIINGEDTKQAVLSEEYIEYVLEQSAIETGVQKKLGKGIFGAVYEGRDPKLHRKFAVKTMHPSVFGDKHLFETAIKTFKKEQEVIFIFPIYTY